jgi:hypothetical protein
VLLPILASGLFFGYASFDMALGTSSSRLHPTCHGLLFFSILRLRSQVHFIDAFHERIREEARLFETFFLHQHTEPKVLTIFSFFCDRHFKVH